MIPCEDSFVLEGMIVHRKDYFGCKEWSFIVRTLFGWKELWYIARTLGCIRDELSIRDGMKTYSYSLVYKGSKYQKSSLSMWEKCDKTFSGKTPLKKTWIIPYWWKVVCLLKMWQGILTKKQFEDTRIVPPGMEFLQHFNSTKRVLAMFFIIRILWINDWERARTPLM